jgi:hypothetical protein
MSLKVSVVVACVALALGGGAPKSCGPKDGGGAPNANAQVNNAPPVKVTPIPAADGGTMAFKVLAEGQYGQVEEPFLVVARDAKTYAALRGLAPDMPELGADFFATQAAVAAFLGMRNTGGFRVEISRGGDGRVHVTERRPPPGVITTQALTQPYRVVAVPVGAEEAVEVEWASAPWSAYRVTSGEFEMSGGIAGRVERFALEGGLRVLRREGLITFAFDLRGGGAGRARALKGAATGLAQADGSFAVEKLDAGTLVERPRSPLRATGRTAEGGARLSLAFESQPATVADGFAGRGRLEAAKQ